jgi:hypothetical protein
MSGQDEGSLSSGLLAIGDDVLAVVTFSLEDVRPDVVALVGDVRASNVVSPAMLASALREVADALEDVACHTCGENHG